MSSLVIFTDADNILVATDTLAVTLTGEPHSFGTKSFYLPHLRMIVAGTGASSFAGDWAFFANGNAMVAGIEHLNAFTTTSLVERWTDFRQRMNAPLEITATVYQLGFSEEDDRLIQYVYRSTNGFLAEAMPQGFSIRPPSAIADGKDMGEVIAGIVQNQRVEQAALGKVCTDPGQVWLRPGGRVGTM